MAQSLRNKFDSEGSRLGYPISPASPQPMAPSPSLPSTMHNQYSLNMDPAEILVSPRYDNTGTTVPYPQPTKLKPLGGPSNNLAAAAGFEVYNNQQTYDDFKVLIHVFTVLVYDARTCFKWKKHTHAYKHVERERESRESTAHGEKHARWQ